MMLFHKIPAIQLIPHDAVIKIRRILHHVFCKCPAIHDARLRNMRFQRIVIAVHPVKIPDDQIGPGHFRQRHQPLGGIRRQPVVTVHKLQVRSRGGCHGHIPGIGHTGILFIYDMDPVIFFLIFLADGQTEIPAAVVDQQYLQRRICLGDHTVQTALQIHFSIINRYDQRNLFHVLLPHFTYFLSNRLQ